MHNPMQAPNVGPGGSAFGGRPHQRPGYTADVYRDPDSGRDRWAVLDLLTRAWYFPSSYGRRAAERLARTLNKHAR
jgi:hypothetical protein